MADPSGLFIVVGAGACLFIGIKIYSYFDKQADKRAKMISDRLISQERAKLTKEFGDKVAELVNVAEARKKELTAQQSHIEQLTVAFDKGYINGRKWLAHFIVEADKAKDEQLSSYYSTKSHPAPVAANEIRKAKTEKREYRERLKYLEYQLRSYLEYFPFLEEYQEVILDESVPLTGGAAIDELDKSDPVLRYVPKTEYDSLSVTERNQRALDRYLSGGLSRAAIGRLYERYVGYSKEVAGWRVEYHGIIEGLEDMGRDLICTKGDEVLIVQAKCWAAEKTIHEKHIFQLFGTTQLYIMNLPERDRKNTRVTAEFVTTTKLSQVAKDAALWLNIRVYENLVMDKGYPIIKCNINRGTKDKIYHLPFDQQYDRTHIDPASGERYAATCAEAEALGFRRAMRYFG